MSDEAVDRAGRQAGAEYEQTHAAFAEVKQAIIDEMIATPPMQLDKIARLHMAAQNLSAVQTVLMQVISAGQVARYALAEAGLTRP